MVKKLVFIGGTMGIGKTIVTTKLNNQLKHSAYLEGDWCWKINPFRETDENMQMVIKNIRFMLNSFLANSSIDYVLFCWGLDQQQTVDDILRGIIYPYELHHISLLTSIEKLTSNIEIDIKTGLRQVEDIERAIQRLNKYQHVNSVKIEHRNINETVETIRRMIVS